MCEVEISLCFDSSCIVLQWVITQYASAMFSMVLVPLYDTLGKDACAFIVNQSKLFFLFVTMECLLSSLCEFCFIYDFIFY